MALVFFPSVFANSSSSNNMHLNMHPNVHLATPATKQELISKGKSLYLANCIACHHRDPNKKGSLGPELSSTPLEVFTFKILTGNQYPEGYTPKRKTKIMKKLPQLEKDIPAIFEWIQSVTVAK